MTVKDLIKHLQKLPQDAIISRTGYEGGFTDDVGEPYEMELYMNVHSEWYYGEHDGSLYIDDESGLKKEKRVIIG